jgi:hypothetical protein
VLSNKKAALLFAGFGLAAMMVSAQQTITIRAWKGQWITTDGAPPDGYGVYHFRRDFELPAKSDRFVIYVSADNRYQLFVNGARVSAGPARGDLTHWRYERVDIAPRLRVGKNAVAAVVWNDGPDRAVAQVSSRTGFLLDTEDAGNAFIATNHDWKSIRDLAYAQQPRGGFIGYYALAPNERVDASQYPWGWEQTDFDDSGWGAAKSISHAADRDARDAPNQWMLVENKIPEEELKPEKPLRIRTAEGIGKPDQPSGIKIPAHTSAAILFDQGYLTTAYPELNVSGGARAELNLRYAEALYDAGKPLKSNRDEIDGKRFIGVADSFLADGGANRLYRPLFWRTYRYLRLEVKTADEELTLNRIAGVFTGYPFERKATFETTGAANEQIQQILTTGWRTARLCAHETYMDCPYYEQLQYGGDARIQMLVSIYTTGDTRLMKNGIALLNSSRTAEGATYSRAPSHLQQYIPPFSLWWIGMVHDYWMYADDPAFVREMLPGVQAVLSFFARYQKENGSLARVPWWNFVDWVKEWQNGEPPADADGTSAAALDLQLLLAYRWAADLDAALGTGVLALQYRKAADQLAATIRKTDWDPGRGLFADQPSHRTWSQQVNTLAVLAHLTEGNEARAVVEKIFSDTTLAQSSIYFLAYTNAALRDVGLGDRYLTVLGPWRHMLDQGLTTWAEWDGPDVRSDCHAWGASPNFELLRTVAGIESGSPGFHSVRISPNLGELPEVKGRMPHPAGEIAVDFKQDGAKLKGTVELPAGTPGVLIWNGRQKELHAGKNDVAF